MGGVLGEWFNLGGKCQTTNRVVRKKNEMARTYSNIRQDFTSIVSVCRAVLGRRETQGGGEE